MDTPHKQSQDGEGAVEALVARFDLLLGKLDSISSSMARIENAVVPEPPLVGVGPARAQDDAASDRASLEAAPHETATFKQTEGRTGPKEDPGRPGDTRRPDGASRPSDVDRAGGGDRTGGRASADAKIGELPFPESTAYVAVPTSHARPDAITARYVVETPHDPHLEGSAASAASAASASAASDSAVSAASANESGDFPDDAPNVQVAGDEPIDAGQTGEGHVEPAEGEVAGWGVGGPFDKWANYRHGSANEATAPSLGNEGQTFEAQPAGPNEGQTFEAQPAGPNERPTFEAQPAKQSLWKRIGGEKQLGRYLLSLAASLLILMAAASLVALLWNAVPHYVKILIIGVVAAALTGVGTRLSLRPGGNKVAAATVMGTGGGLGFVAIIGGVLLGGTIPPGAAILLLTAWSVVLILLAGKARTFFAALIVGAGGIVTVILARTFAYDNLAQAPKATWAIFLYVASLTLVCGFVARKEASYKLRTAYAAIALAVTAAGLAATPYVVAATVSPVSSSAALLATLAWTLGVYAMVTHWAIAAWPMYSDALCGGWFAGCLAAVQVFSAMRNAPLPIGADEPWALLALLGAVLAATLAVSVLPLNARSSAYAGLSASATAVTLGVVDLFNARWSSPARDVHPALQLIVVGTVALSAVPTVRRRSAEHAVIMPATLLLFEIQQPGGTAREVLSLLAAAITVGVVLIVSRRASNRPVLIASSWALAVAVVGAVPVHLLRLASAAGLQDEWRLVLHIALVNLAVALLIYAGLPTSKFTPTELLCGKGRGERPPFTRVVMMQTIDRGNPKTVVKPTTVLLLAPVGICFGVLCYECLAVLLVRDAESPPAKAAFLATLLALNMALTWMAWPAAENVAGSAVVAANTTIGVVGGFFLFGGVSGGSSVFGTIAFLTAGTVCVLIGFIARGKALRIYGLGLIMVMVLRFAIVDMAGQNSLVRIVSLLLAGLVCFGLSLAYARFSSIFDGGDEGDGKADGGKQADGGDQAGGSANAVGYGPSADAAAPAPH